MSAAIRLALGVLLILLILPLTARAGAKDVIQSKQGELAMLLKKGGGESDARISVIFDELIDYRALAERSLGKHWAERSEAERSEFTTVLQGLVKAAYRKNLRKTLAYDVAIQGANPVDGGVLVKTVATHRTKKREAPISIDYLLHNVGGGWKIRDIVTEGSSLAKNYSSQFSRVIRKKGFAELLIRMKKKLKK